VVQHGASLSRESGEPALTEAVASADFDSLPPRMATLCRHALALTVRPWTIGPVDVDVLRAAGLADRDIVDANQVAAYYNYVNRVADGLGVELEDDWPSQACEPRTYAIRTKA
jgi:uncharacterized peroxidase-related enzyme